MRVSDVFWGLSSLPLAVLGLNEVGRVGTSQFQFSTAFLRVTEHKELFISTFYNDKWGFSAADAVHKFDLLGNGLIDESSGELAVEMTWPNDVIPNDSVFTLASNGKALRAASVAGGFIVGENKGQVNVIIDVEDPELPYVHFQVSKQDKTLFGKDEDKWLYHKAVWVDVDGDGLLDLVTARSDFGVPPFGITYKSQVLWLRNNGKTAITAEMIAKAKQNNGDISSLLETWEQHIIDDGSKFGAGDTMVKIHDFEGDGKIEILVTHFWKQDAGIFSFANFWRKDPGQSVVVYSLKSGQSSWQGASYPDQVDRTTVVSGVGGPFDIELHDLNKDGKLDLLTSNHEKGENDALVLGYEIPQNWKQAWTKHELKRGFKTRVPEGMSPGAAQTFYPTSDRSQKPWVLVSGDGTGNVHLLIPNSESTSNWGYTEYFLYDTASDNQGVPKTTGQIAVDDSGACSMIYIPSYEPGQILVFDGCVIGNNLASLKTQTDLLKQKQASESPPGSNSAPTENAFVLSTSAIVGVAAGCVAIVALLVTTARKRANSAAARRNSNELPSYKSETTLDGAPDMKVSTNPKFIEL